MRQNMRLFRCTSEARQAGHNIRFTFRRDDKDPLDFHVEKRRIPSKCIQSDLRMLASAHCAGVKNAPLARHGLVMQLAIGYITFVSQPLKETSFELLSKPAHV